MHFLRFPVNCLQVHLSLIHLFVKLIILDFNSFFQIASKSSQGETQEIQIDYLNSIGLSTKLIKGYNTFCLCSKPFTGYPIYMNFFT